jgi:hypothetical protein
MFGLGSRKRLNVHVVSSFLCAVNENSALLGYYAASSGNSLPTFRNKLGPLEMEPIGVDPSA